MNSLYLALIGALALVAGLTGGMIDPTTTFLAASSVSAPEVVKLFKNVYGDLHDLLPEDYPIGKDIPFDSKKMVGEKFVEAVILSNEVGITLGGSGTEAFEINPAIAGATKQAEVTPSVSVLPSLVPWSVISRSAGAGEKAFFDATKQIVKNNLKSHGKFQEIFRLYGQADLKLGSVSYATATYRGVALTDGSGTLPFKGTDKAFTNGVRAADKLILFAPGQFAAGHWVGSRGMQIQQIVTATGAVAAEGKLVSVDAKQGIIEVDFTPVAATGADSHHIGIKGQAELGEMQGIQKILSTVGTLFGINNNVYELFRGNVEDVQNGKLTLSKIQDGIANAVNQGELEDDLVVYVNPRTWATMVTTESGAREYDHSYNPNEAQNGFKDIVFYGQNGKNTIKAHRYVKEGDAFGLCLKEWTRSGSSEISFTVPGMKQELIFPLENQAAYAFRSYSDQYIFCYGPSKSIYWKNINDEATS